MSSNTKNLESIMTSAWSNIPPCIVNAFNIIINHLSLKTTELEDVSNSLSELIIKFQVKTKRYDETFQQISSSIKSLTSSTTKEINECKEKSEEIDAKCEKINKTVKDSIGELRGNFNSYQNEYRKETREASNKFEKFKKEIEKVIDENLDISMSVIEKNDGNINKKLQAFMNQSQILFEDSKKTVKKIEDSFVSTDRQISILEAFNTKHLEKFQNINREISEIQGKSKSIEKKLKFLNTQIESLSMPVAEKSSSSSSSSNTPRSNKEVSFINPLTEKLKDLEEKFEILAQQSDLTKANLDIFNTSHTEKLGFFKESIEKWTNSMITKSFHDIYSRFKEKLDWLPDGYDDIKGMSVTEARLFLIESRIRQEEKARILSDHQIKSDLTCLKDKNTKTHSKNSISGSPNYTRTTVLDVDKAKRIRNRIRPSSCIKKHENISKSRLETYIF